MTATVTFGAYTALVGICQTALTPLGVTVYDGPQVTMPSDLQMLIVGCEDPTQVGEGVAFDAGIQTWESLGAYIRKEEFYIPCSYIAWNGDNDLVAARANAAAMLTALANATYASPAGTGTGQLGAALAPTGWCWISVVRTSMQQTSSGASIHTQFNVNCVSYID